MTLEQRIAELELKLAHSKNRALSRREYPEFTKQSIPEMLYEIREYHKVTQAMLAELIEDKA